MSVLGLKSGNPSGSGHILPYIPPLVLIRIQYTPSSTGWIQEYIDPAARAIRKKNFSNIGQTEWTILIVWFLEINKVCIMIQVRNIQWNTDRALRKSHEFKLYFTLYPSSCHNTDTVCIVELWPNLVRANSTWKVKIAPTPENLSGLLLLCNTYMLGMCFGRKKMSSKYFLYLFLISLNSLKDKTLFWIEIFPCIPWYSPIIFPDNVHISVYLPVGSVTQ